MTHDDLHIFCTALGFMAVILNDAPENKRAQRAVVIGGLIEAFCNEHEAEKQKAKAHLDKLINHYKGELERKQKVDLPPDYNALLELYDRLRERHRFYATENHLADEVEHLLGEEILFDTGVTHPAPPASVMERMKGTLDVQNRMTEAIAKIIKAKGNCKPSDLHDLNEFSRDDIAHHWPMAYALAQTKVKGT